MYITSIYRSLWATTQLR